MALPYSLLLYQNFIDWSRRKLYYDTKTYKKIQNHYHNVPNICTLCQIFNFQRNTMRWHYRCLCSFNVRFTLKLKDLTIPICVVYRMNISQYYREFSGFNYASFVLRCRLTSDHGDISHWGPQGISLHFRVDIGVSSGGHK